MTNENSSDGDKSFKELMARPIKAVSIDQIEQAISKALLELTGQEYEIDVNRLDLNPEPNSWANDTALMDLKLSKKTKKDPNSPFG